MLCPLCGDTNLEPHFRLGIEIDVCPTCKGVWLDRGELDRLVADPPPREPADLARYAPAPAPVTTPSVDDRQPVGTRRDDRADRERKRDWDRDDDRDRDDERERASSKKKKKKKSKSKRLSDALEDLFDDILDF